MLWRVMEASMRLLMMGTGPFAVPTFESLLDSPQHVVALVTRPIPPAKGRRKAAANPMRDVAVERGVPILEPADVNTEDAVRELAALRADLLVVCDYGQILSTATLGVAPLGGINLHASLLPKYRGAAPINWALYHGESETGVTVIHMTPKMDAGPCVAMGRTAIGLDEDAIQLEERLSQLGAQTVARAIAAIQVWDRQSPIGLSQDPAGATKAPRLKKTDGMVNWSRTARQIANQVRALKPWPGTFTTWPRPDGRPVRLILDQVSVVETEPPAGLPGHVVTSGKRELVVATGDGLLSIDRLQPAGKRSMDIEEFLRGHTIDVGTRLG
jgi:methionyl-tRNA formyltransferase